MRLRRWDHSQARPTGGHSRARPTPLLGPAALWPFPPQRPIRSVPPCPSVLRTAALDPIGHWSLCSTFHLLHPAPCAHVVREGLPYGPCPQRSQITKVISFRSLQEAAIRHHRCRSYAMGETLFTIISITIRARAGGRVGTTPCSLLCYTFLPLLPLLPL